MSSMGVYNPKEKKRARMIFKRLKAGIVSYDDLSDEDRAIFEKYYGWVMKK